MARDHCGRTFRLGKKCTKKKCFFHNTSTSSGVRFAKDERVMMSLHRSYCETLLSPKLVVGIQPVSELHDHFFSVVIFRVEHTSRWSHAGHCVVFFVKRTNTYCFDFATDFGMVKRPWKQIKKSFFCLE